MRALFPPFSQGTYLDYAATAPIFLSVLDATRDFELAGRGNPRRGLHAYATHATDALESARKTVAAFVGAEPEGLVFTKSATEALNLAIASYTKDLDPEDVVVHTIFDHNSAYLPLKRAADERGFVLYEMTLDAIRESEMNIAAFAHRIKLVVVPHVSNVTGEILPVAEIAKAAHDIGAKVIADGAQAVAHMPVNIKELGADAYAFSAHKMYGPMGIGALAFPQKLYTSITPFLLGGGMTEPGVAMLEAGTPNVTGAVGFAKACEELLNIGWSNVEKHERVLMEDIVRRVGAFPGVVHHKPRTTNHSLFAFSVHGVHPHDVAQVLADQGVAVRAGHHCAPHISRLLHPAGVVRASIGLGTTEEDVQRFLDALQEVKKLAV